MMLTSDGRMRLGTRFAVVTWLPIHSIVVVTSRWYYLEFAAMMDALKYRRSVSSSQLRTIIITIDAVRLSSTATRRETGDGHQQLPAIDRGDPRRDSNSSCASINLTTVSRAGRARSETAPW
jgi:hypothetical protein